MKKSWIKVTDKLPDNENDVLVYDETGCIEFAWYCIINKKWYECTGYNQNEYEYEITHWQPLKKPE